MLVCPGCSHDNREGARFCEECGLPLGKRLGGNWLLAAGAVVGFALGILVSVTTDLPLAPEAGLVIGLALGWLVRRRSA